ncbi:MAG TPA: L-seryl-tRNA(Sec) selenium transferase [Acidimicrobiia bacterium]|nr:L-seryl-tRNA(Sec) selenium transferase [Acidimicrobiia bacterium]
MAEPDDPRRALPQVERVVAALEPDGIPRTLVTDAARAAVAEARERVGRGDPVVLEDVVDRARSLAGERSRTLLRPVLNATGVLLHTNLGRAPLGQDALDAVEDVASGYSNLEYRLADGRRGSRHDHAGALLARAVGAEAGVVVNNNAAAVLLSLAALARHRAVVVSRGELVEIGGGFRVPDIMNESGCRLVEVGTTNRTRVGDYERALNGDVALVLKVHASNYRMVGFVESTPVHDLARLGPPVLFDAGSGLLDATTPWLPARPPWLGDEPGVRQAIDDGAALVTFSGDKLLGGPQAGVVVGRGDLVARIVRHPLARAFRADKMTLAAMQSVAAAYLDGRGDAIPLWRMATVPVRELRARAERIAADVTGAKVVETSAAAGGGSLPGLTIPSAGVAVESASADHTLRVLRDLDVVARVEDDAVVCDLRAVAPADDARLTNALRAALGERTR